MKALLASVKNNIALTRAFQDLPIEISHELAFQRYPNMGLGLTAQTLIPPNEAIIQVEDFLSGNEFRYLDQMKIAAIEPLMTHVADQFPHKSHIRDRIFLAYQISNLLRTTKHQLNHYLDHLPTAGLNMPYYWTDITSTYSIYCKNMIIDEVNSIDKIYGTIYTEERKTSSNVAIEEYVWTHAIALNRGTVVDGNMHIIPLIDYVNHSFEPNWEIERRKGQMRLNSTKEIKAGEQLLINYGPYDSYTYLLRYGFVPEGNPNSTAYCYPEYIDDYAELLHMVGLADKSPITQMENKEGYSMKSLKQALRQKYNIDDASEIRITKNFPLEHEEIALRIFFLKINDLKSHDFQDVSDAMKLDFTRQIGPHNEKNMWLLMIKTLSFHLRCLPDEEKGSTETGRLIEEEEKRILREALAFYTDKFDSIVIMQ